MTTAGDCAGTAIVLDSDNEDEGNEVEAEVVVHRARKSITEKVDECQRVLVQLTRGYTVSSFFEPRKKTRYQSSQENPVFLDDEDEDECDCKKEQCRENLSLFGHTRQLSGEEMESLQQLLDLREIVPLKMKETDDWENDWKDIVAEVEGTKEKRVFTWKDTAHTQPRSGQGTETLHGLSCDDVSKSLASVKTDMDETKVRDIVDEVFKEYERGRKDQRQMLWSEKYRPHQSRFLCTTKKATEQFGTWLSGWADIVNEERKEMTSEDRSVPKEEKRKQTTPCLCVVCGNGSCGKTTMVYTCAEERGMEVMEMNASECRSGQNVLKRVSESVGTQRIGPETYTEQEKSKKTKTKNRRRIILFDDADVVLNDDKGFYHAIAKLAESSDYPIVLTCRHRTQKIMKLSQGALVIHLLNPEESETLLVATTITITELFGLQKEPPQSVDESARAKSVASNLHAILLSASQSLPVQSGLKGLLLWAQMHLRDATTLQQPCHERIVSCEVVGLSNSFASCDNLEADLETCHLQGIDCGFDSWSSWDGCTHVTEFTNVASLFSDLDVFDSCSWSTPEGTLPFWHRASPPSTIFEAQILNSHPASLKPWTLDRSFKIPDSSLSLNRAGLSRRFELPLQVPRPRQLSGMRISENTPSWISLTTLLPRDASSTCAWGTEVLPALRSIIKSETIRKQKKRRRFFFHHLTHFTAHDIADVAQSSLRCDRVEHCTAHT